VTGGIVVVFRIGKERNGNGLHRKPAVWMQADDLFEEASV